MTRIGFSAAKARLLAIAPPASSARTIDRFGARDILVDNAGVNTFVHRVDIDLFLIEEWHSIISVDLDGLFLASRGALKRLLERGGGGISVNIASVVGLAAKAGIIHRVRSMALELGAKGVRVNAVAPGSIMTDGARKVFDGEDGSFHARMQALMDHIPLARPGTVDEIVERVLFLAAPESRYVKGHGMTIDGGWTAGYMM